MTANDPLQRWRDQLHELQAERLRLTETWDDCLSELLRTGCPPERALLEDQSAYGRQLSALCAEVSQDCSLSQGLTVESREPDKFSESPALDDLARNIQEYSLKQHARMVLERLLQLEHVTDPHFEPLQAVHDQARGWLSDLSQSPVAEERRTELQSLTAGEHPFCDLLRWQHAAEALNDDAWDRLHDRVADHFGRALATAVGRGRIVDRSSATGESPESRVKSQPRRELLLWLWTLDSRLSTPPARPSIGFLKFRRRNLALKTTWRPSRASSSILHLPAPA